MLAALLARIAMTDLIPLARTLATRLLERGEATAIDAAEAYLRELIAAPDPSTTFLAGAAHRLDALRLALDQHDADEAALTPHSDRGPWAESIEDGFAPAPLDPDRVARRLRAVPAVTFGAPRVERDLLDERGRNTYAWIEGDQVHALGPARAAVAAALAPIAVHAPAWHPRWATLTAADRNPWQVSTAAATDPELADALARTAACQPRPPYRSADPRAGFLSALTQWSRQAIAGLGDRFATAGAEEVRPCGDDRARAALAELATRPASLATAALVPLVLVEMATGPLVEVAPTPPGLAFDVIGRAAGGCVRARALRFSDPPRRLTAVTLPRMPRGATVVDGGDMLITLFGP